MTHTAEDIQAAMLAWLSQHVQDTTVSANTSLVSSMILDSLGVEELLMWIEDRYGVSITPTERVDVETPADFVRVIVSKL